nr:MAG TPA: hypothetical protein [Caudoviricetes sp.]
MWIQDNRYFCISVYFRKRTDIMLTKYLYTNKALWRQR